MKLGIDFGTSYTAAAAVVDGAIQAVRFDGGATQFRTAVYLPRYRAQAADFRADEGELARRLASARRAQAALARQLEALPAGPRLLSEAELETREREILRREWLREEAEQLDVAKALDHAVFGEAAVEEFMAAPDGALVESPKSMLGYRLAQGVREHIERIVTAVLRHVRETAEAQFGKSVTAATLGRPVVFKGTAGLESQRQAEDILRDSARRAGFAAIDFEFEPVAAALYHHDGLERAEDTLIVDVGGGTTDVTHALLGADQGPRVYGSWGEPVGGTDIDYFLNLYGLMPHFGRNRCQLGAHRYSEAANVRHVVEQRAFRQGDLSERAGEFAHRLARLQLDGGTTYLNYEAERAKIALAQTERTWVDLSRFEAGLLAELDAEHLARATGEVFPKLRRVLAQALAAMPASPERIFLTGGSSRSPLVQALVRELAPTVPLLVGNPSFSVVSGLALRAAGRYRLSPATA
ncbi:MAG: Hsp70 family protein [Gammaproteobacteria bacterium]|nr:Hsp70 family protein [Gammaproteobacteria bacterium]